ncbi:MAG: APC family permease [Candidatus Rokuibacteriota bacterium]
MVGVPFWSTANFTETPHGLGGVWSAASLIFFAYLGFDELGNFAEEMRHPERDLPRALFISVVTTTGIYVLVALSSVAAVGWQELSGSGAPLALAVHRALGARADTALSVVALCATANTVLLMLLSAARSVYGMAVAGMLPASLAAVGQRTAVPVVATVVVVVFTAPLVLLGDLAGLAAMTDAAVLLSFAMVNLALLWLSARRAIDRRLTDRLFPGAAALLCVWLLTSHGVEGSGRGGRAHDRRAARGPQGPAEWQEPAGPPRPAPTPAQLTC